MGRSNNAGFTIVESLIASSIIVSSALAFSGSLYYFTKARQKAAAVSAAVALAEVVKTGAKEAERSSSGGLTDPNTLTLPLKLDLDPTSTKPVTNITITNGATGASCFKSDLTSCNCADYGKDCSIKLETQMRTVGGQKRWAYKVLTNSELVDMPPIGSSQFTNASASGGFSDTDFTQQIGEEHRNVGGGNNVGRATVCDPTTTVGASGFNRTTGELVCLKKPLDSMKCAEGTIPKKVVVEATADGKPLAVKLECSPRFQTLGCSDDYFVLQSLNLASMEPGQTKSGTCVFAGAESAVYKMTLTDGSSGRIWGRVCPAFYKSVSTCTVKSLSATPGICQDEVAVQKEKTYTTPDGKQSCTQKWTEYAWSGTVSRPAPMDTNAITTNYGGNVDCQVNVPAQECSPTQGPRGITASSWTAYVEVNVKCELEDVYKATRAAN